MPSFLLSVVVISLSGVMMPGPLFAVTVAKSYKSQFAGAQIAAGHALVEIPLMLLIYFGLGRFFQYELVQLTLSLLGGVVLLWLGIGMFRARTRVVEMGYVTWSGSRWFRLLPFGFVLIACQASYLVSLKWG